VSVVKPDGGSPKKKLTKKRSGSKTEVVLKPGDEAYGQPAARGQPDQAAEGAAAVEEDIISPVISPVEEGEGAGSA